MSGRGNRCSEVDPHARIEGSALQRRPYVGDPTTVRRSFRSEQRVPSCLSRVEDVLGVEEDAEPAEPAIDEKPQNEVRRGASPVGIVVELLRPCVIRLDPDSTAPFLFERAHQPHRMPRR